MFCSSTVLTITPQQHIQSVTVNWIGSCKRHYLPRGKSVQEASRSSLRTRVSFKEWVAADSPEKMSAEAANLHIMILSFYKHCLHSTESCANIWSYITYTNTLVLLATLDLSILKKYNPICNLNLTCSSFSAVVYRDRKREVRTRVFQVALGSKVSTSYSTAEEIE